MTGRRRHGEDSEAGLAAGAAGRVQAACPARAPSPRTLPVPPGGARSIVTFRRGGARPRPRAGLSPGRPASLPSPEAVRRVDWVPATPASPARHAALSAERGGRRRANAARDEEHFRRSRDQKVSRT